MKTSYATIHFNAKIVKYPKKLLHNLRKLQSFNSSFGAIKVNNDKSKTCKRIQVSIPLLVRLKLQSDFLNVFDIDTFQFHFWYD